MFALFWRCPVQINEYEILSELGRGTFGTVFLAERRVAGTDPEQYALKRIDKRALSKAGLSFGLGGGRTLLDKVYDEIEVMSGLYHRYCVLLFEVIDDPDASKLYLVLEYMPGGTAMHPASKRPGGFDYTPSKGPMPESVAQRYFFGVLKGLQYLHGKSVAHRDLKPDNLLISEKNRCLIGDFGCAQRIVRDSPPPMLLGLDTLPSTLPPTSSKGGGGFGAGHTGLVCDTVGAPSFQSPQAVSGEYYDPFDADVWAAGVTLYCFLYGQVPYYSGDIMTDIMSKELPLAWPPVPHPPLDGDCDGDSSSGGCVSCVYGDEPSPAAKDLVSKLLEKDVTRRISIADALAHPWLASQVDE